MNMSPDELIHGYLDETLSEEQLETLAQWLKADAKNAEQFAQMCLLHNELRATWVDEPMVAGAAWASSMTAKDVASENPVVIVPTVHDDVSQDQRSHWLRRQASRFGPVLSIAAMLFLIIWFRGGVHNEAAAASAELHRIADVAEVTDDVKFAIAVEQRAKNVSERGKPESGRPPKPSLADATLYLRNGGQFVLICRNPDREPYITGRDTTFSWAIAPNGPVRVTRDRDEFNRDVPGHEHDMPLTNIRQWLSHMSDAYELSLLPQAVIEKDTGGTEIEDVRTIFATKRRGQRGPKRVEIQYSMQTGVIQSLRFVDMPYGPERITVVVTRQLTESLPGDFFHHTAHHDGQRRVIQE